MTGDQFASVVHAMLLNLDKAVSIPLVVSRAAAGDYAPLKHAGSGDLPFTIGLMSSIWCNEPWTGLDATGPWGTQFDSYTTAQIAAVRHQCNSVPKRAELHAFWRVAYSEPKGKSVLRRIVVARTFRFPASHFEGGSGQLLSPMWGAARVPRPTSWEVRRRENYLLTSAQITQGRTISCPLVLLL